MTLKTKRTNGFTMTELLVVIVIMAILMAIGGMSILQSNIGRGLEAGVTSFESIVSEARKLAVSRQTNARLLINDDPTDRENYRRQLITVFDADSDPNVEDWQVAFRAVKLPPGVYVDTDQFVNTSAELGELGQGSGIDFTRGVAPAHRYIEFNQLGICKQDDATEPGASLVIVSGKIEDGVVVTNGQLKTGIVIWRTGTSTIVNDLDIIESKL